jgi:hypothetical protein
MRRINRLFAVAAVLFVAGFVATPACAVFTAYINPAGSFTAYTGGPFGTIPWGMDFDVNAAPVSVTALGVYDFLQDGNFLHDVIVGIYNRDTQTLFGTTLTFSSASPGTLEGGSRFKQLSSPLQLTAGFHGSVVAWGFTETGSGGEPFIDESNNTPTWTLDTGGGLLSFVGTSRLLSSGSASITYPTVPDLFFTHSAFARNQYMTGTFKYTAIAKPAVPADYNGNGIVDAADYTLWRDTLGQSGLGLAADGTGPAGVPDGVVDQLDYDFWKANFGNHSGAGASTNTTVPVPEPTTVVMLLTGMLTMCCCRRPMVPQHWRAATMDR